MVKISLCQGAYDTNKIPTGDPKTPITIVPSPPTPPPKVPTPKTPEPTCVEGPADIVDAAYNKEAVGDTKITGEKLKDVKEYGYGFWLRFLSRHPVPLLPGKNAPWYFVSRLTRNLPYDNINMGDRTLAVWLG